MATPSVKAQINMCSSSILALKHLSESIDIARQQVDNLVMVLEEKTFEEYLNEIKGLQEYYKTASNYTQDFIAENHINYLDTQIQALASTITGSNLNNKNP